MKVIHLSDLHIGKRVNEFSMIEDQEYILEEILKIIDSENPEVVMIAGDVYDKSVPPAEAVGLFDDFLFKLAKREVTVLIIAGNHDSVARLSFGSRIFDNSGVYISPIYDGNIKEVSLSDEYGSVNFYLLPFIKPVNVRQCFPEEEINSYTDAVRVAIENIDLNEDERNVLITHQFVTGAVRSDSEEVSVGGSDNVDGEVFKKFDYVALGHIHKPQKIMRDTIRYCGTPLKYSFSEASHQKSVTILEFGDKKEEVKIRMRELIPLRDLREIRGTYMEVTAKSFYENTNKEDYLHITLTDEENIVDAIGKLRTIYPNIMRIDYDNERTRTENKIDRASDVETKSPLELFEDFYKLQNNGEINSEQENYLVELIEKVWEGK
ncbi:Exodeoxyribonuclease I subunit D [Anaerosphaera aminiphila DSM 21120]|uniref:Nuclease SbcCD subunit D n=1 Tax=Anaerosphaera aminiphila DSM 21120 TaxID=1120995 RepID=A0A1M5Q4C5_9FIRM|nr:exonuclease SbcCD subunit D [Anaerosphaera aminiphila]SHH08985.1 Exodeoxyribonuclease I subunit D [Anaerosphaera aminiphila DSM 21120]